MSIAVVNGKLCDEQKNIHVRNLLIQGGKITGVGYIPDEDEAALTLCDVSQSMMLPNTFDFLPLPEPSTIASYTQFVQSKGMINMAYIPNASTDCLDSPDVLKGMVDALGSLSTHVTFIASASKGNEANDLSELSLLVDAGASAIYFDRIIENEGLFKQALTYVDMIGVPIIFGPMTTMQRQGAHLNEGPTSFEIGIRGEAEQDEFSTIQYVLNLVQSHVTVPVHFHCVSSIRAIEAICQFKQASKGLISLGVSPFHLVFSDDVLRSYNAKLKFNPPLRSNVTMSLLNEALADGRVDHLTSLHYPQVGDSQALSFFDHPFEVQTLDFFFQVVSHCLVSQGVPLDGYERLLSCPVSLSFFSPVTLGLHSTATFTVLKAVSDQPSSMVLFDDLNVELNGGLKAIVNQGDLVVS